VLKQSHRRSKFATHQVQTSSRLQFLMGMNVLIEAMRPAHLSEKIIRPGAHLVERKQRAVNERIRASPAGAMAGQPSRLM
jgi:hypothetical protein